MPGWNFADVFEVVAETVPGAPALIQGQVELSWAELDRRAEAVAGHLVAAGLRRQDKVAQFLPNRSAYVESFIGSLKGSFVPVNTNYRYGPDELAYLWDDADVAAVVFWAPYSDTVEAMRDRVPRVLSWLYVDDGFNECPSWATPYDEVVAGAADASQARRFRRDGHDLVLTYTGGTTGMPKGVMWRQDDLFVQLGNGAGGRYPDEPDLEVARAKISRPGRRHLPAAPLIHGAGCFTCLPVLSRGGAVVLLERVSFDATELLDTVERERVNSIMWVGDPFAKPVLAALDAHPGRWELSSLKTITSGGAMFSEESKRGILRHGPHLVIADVFGASETTSMGTSVSTADGSSGRTASFTPGSATRVIDDDGNDVVPGSGQMGLLAFGGRQPIGYYKDESKTVSTFKTINGRRYAIPGDWATVDADGTVTLLGRGSACINSGGEKVFPEEVEEVLKRHPQVYDAVVLGAPDARFGQAVVAVVELNSGSLLHEAEVTSHVKAHLASYKAPRHVVFVPSIGRGPNGKVDIKAVTDLALAELARR